MNSLTVASKMKNYLQYNKNKSNPIYDTDKNDESINAGKIILKQVKSKSDKNKKTKIQKII